MRPINIYLKEEIFALPRSTIILLILCRDTERLIEVDNTVLCEIENFSVKDCSIISAQVCGF